jgi:hypothetical protein
MIKNIINEWKINLKEPMVYLFLWELKPSIPYRKIYEIVLLFIL